MMGLQLVAGLLLGGRNFLDKDCVADAQLADAE